MQGRPVGSLLYAADAEASRSVSEDHMSTNGVQIEDNSDGLPPVFGDTTPRQITSDGSKEYNEAMRRLIDRRMSSDGGNHFDSSMSIGERLRHGEFIHDTEGNQEVSPFDVNKQRKKAVPKNKYVSDDSLTDESQMVQIRNTII